MPFAPAIVERACVEWRVVHPNCLKPAPAKSMHAVLHRSTQISPLSYQYKIFESKSNWQIFMRAGTILHLMENLRHCDHAAANRLLMQWMLWYCWRIAVRPLNGFGQWRRKERERERESNDMPRLNWQPWHAIGVQNAERLENASVIASYTHKIHLSVVSWLATSHAGHLMDLICQQVSSMGPLSTNAMRYVWPVFGLHHHHSPRILRNQDVREIFLKTLRCDCNHVELLLEMSQSGARSCITMPDFLNLPVVFLSGLDD